MKMMQGEFCFACSNRSRTRDAPTPTNISTKSDPEIEKNGTPASPATARASSVLPEPRDLFRIPEEFLDLVKLLDSLVDASHVAESDLRRIGRQALGARLAERH